MINRRVGHFWSIAWVAGLASLFVAGPVSACEMAAGSTCAASVECACCDPADPAPEGVAIPSRDQVEDLRAIAVDHPAGTARCICMPRTPAAPEPRSAPTQFEQRTARPLSMLCAVFDPFHSAWIPGIVTPLRASPEFPSPVYLRTSRLLI
jgi:hypothetical protein